MVDSRPKATTLQKRHWSFSRLMVSKASSDSSQEVQRLFIETARIQLAAVSAAVKFWASWAESADKYTQALSGDLAKMSEKEIKTSEIIARTADLTREYVRNLTDLPSVALRRFSSEIEKVGSPKGSRKRAARAKD
jgi:hypothetical protein